MHVVDSDHPGGLVSLGCGLREVWRREAGANRCRRVAEDRLPVCRTCRERLRRELTELPELYGHCESLLVRYPLAFAQRLAGSPAAAGLSLHEPATNARRDIVAVLASWCALVADELVGVARPRCRDVGVLAAFLTAHIDWLLAHPAVSCFAEELVAVAAAAREVSRTGSASIPDIELGQCVEEGCDNNMIAARTAEGRASSVEVRCTAGHVWQAGQWLQLAGQLRGRSRMSA